MATSTTPGHGSGQHRSVLLQTRLNIHGLLVPADHIHAVDPYDQLLNNVDECDTLLFDPLFCLVIQEHLDALLMMGGASPARPSLHTLALSSERITPEERSIGTFTQQTL